jgi:hypothetical protein
MLEERSDPERYLLLKFLLEEQADVSACVVAHFFQINETMISETYEENILLEVVAFRLFRGVRQMTMMPLVGVEQREIDKIAAYAKRHGFGARVYYQHHPSLYTTKLQCDSCKKWLGSIRWCCSSCTDGEASCRYCRARRVPVRHTLHRNIKFHKHSCWGELFLTERFEEKECPNRQKNLLFFTP